MSIENVQQSSVFTAPPCYVFVTDLSNRICVKFLIVSITFIVHWVWLQFGSVVGLRVMLCYFFY